MCVNNKYKTSLFSTENAAMTICQLTMTSFTEFVNTSRLQILVINCCWLPDLQQTLFSKKSLQDYAVYHVYAFVTNICMYRVGQKNRTVFRSL